LGHVPRMLRSAKAVRCQTGAHGDENVGFCEAVLLTASRPGHGKAYPSRNRPEAIRGRRSTGQL